MLHLRAPLILIAVAALSVVPFCTIIGWADTQDLGGTQVGFVIGVLILLGGWILCGALGGGIWLISRIENADAWYRENNRTR